MRLINNSYYKRFEVVISVAQVEEQSSFFARGYPDDWLDDPCVSHVSCIVPANPQHKRLGGHGPGRFTTDDWRLAKRKRHRLGHPRKHIEFSGTASNAWQITDNGSHQFSENNVCCISECTFVQKLSSASSRLTHYTPLIIHHIYP